MSVSNLNRTAFEQTSRHFANVALVRDVMPGNHFARTDPRHFAHARGGLKAPFRIGEGRNHVHVANDQVECGNGIELVDDVRKVSERCK